MPEWTTKKLIPLKELIEIYVNCLNSRDFDSLLEHLTEDVTIARGKTVSGKTKFIELLQDLFSRESLSNIKFELIDATADFFNENEAQILLYFEIFQDAQKKETFIESLFLAKTNDKWKLDKVFGLSFDPKAHKKCFKTSLDS